MKKIVVFITLMFMLLICMSSCDMFKSSDAKLEHTHEFGAWETTKNATCINEGVKVRYCSCGEQQSEAIPSLSHNVVIDEAINPTCNKAGLTEGKHCSVCNETIVTQTVINPLGHTEVIDPAVSSTCTATGLTEGKHCSVCNEVIIKQIETPKNNHSYDNKYDEECNECGFVRDAECPHTNVSTLNAKNSTCTEPGLTEGKVCVDCEEVIVAQIVINALGHTEVIDSSVSPTYEETGLTEGKHCSVCGTVLIEQQTIPMLQPKYHTITYKNTKGTDYESRYAEHIGLLDLAEVSAEGYTFQGWYTKSIGGELIDYIPKGSTQDYVLFAHWELINYEITYINAARHTNPTTYNIENKLKLKTPEWSGLVFTHWSDEEGNIYTPDADITSLPEKMTGDLVLTANWQVWQNRATPASSNSKIYSVFSGEDGMLYCYYDLGTIENVVLNYSDLFRKVGEVEKDLTITKTITISEETATEISNTFSEAISKTDSFEKSYSAALSHSENWNSQINGGLEGGIGGGNETGGEVTIAPAKISLKNLFEWNITGHIQTTYDIGGEDSYSTQWGETNSSSNEFSESQSKTIVSSMAYKKEISSEIEESYKISKDLPDGYYACVNAANVKVIAIVTYEISTGYIYLNTYSYLDDMHSTVLYYADVNQLENPNVEGLDFKIPEKEIVDLVEKSYYIKYDSNGGIGTMPTTIHSIDTYENIPKNAFTKEGCVFSGWELIGNTNVQILQDGQPIKNLGKALETITLKAIWTSATYTIQYDANGGKGTMPSSTHTIDTYEEISANTFTKSGYRFLGWKLTTEDGEITLQDKDTVKNLAKGGETITLSAIWEAYYTIDGNYIYFGEYPQSIKSNDVTISSTTDKRGYYLGSDGYYYAKVTAKPYESDYTFSTGTTIKNNTVYYFKVEPIRWRIAYTEGENALIICDSIIAPQKYDYQRYDNYYTTSNNYAESAVRQWLNATFYSTVFTSLQKDLIIATRVDNSASSTGYSENPYVCDDTNDKLFLLSYDEVNNIDLGFSTNEEREMQTSDYSRAMGIYMDTSTTYYGNSFWWLRSPCATTSAGMEGVRIINSDGNIANQFGIDLTNFGVVPAMWIKL